MEILNKYGFLVDTAEDGAEAVEKVKNSTAAGYDLVLMDVQMPVTNGYEATKQIRALEDPKLAGITILAMTANAFEEDRKKALECGMDGFLSKPIVNKDLIDAISQVKNININAYIPDIQGEKVLRHFYGVQDEILAQLPDTPLRDIATPELQEGGRWGLYYKCPCDIAAGAKCYNCQVCWLAKPGIAPNGELVPQFNVLCKIHGVNKSNFNPKIADKRRGMTPEQQKKNIKKMVTIARDAENKNN